MASSLSRIMRGPVRTSSSSSTINTRITGTPPPRTARAPGIRPRAVPPSPACRRTARHSGRISTRTSVAGAALLIVFGAVSLTTAPLNGAPAEAGFLLFGLGLLLTVVGNTALAIGVRRAGLLPALWLAPLVAAAGAFVAVTVFADPWHDLGLFTFDAAWVALGVFLRSSARHLPTASVPAGRERPFPDRMHEVESAREA